MMVLGHLGLTLFPFLIKKDLDWDIRLLVLGAFLPDLIDKPIGHLLLPQNNGRIIGHTLLFAVSFLLASTFFRKLTPVAFGVIFHQLLDGMFMDPQSALWPFMGGFRTTTYEVVEWLYAYTDPYVLTEEFAGLLVLLMLVHGTGVSGIWNVLKYGKLSTR
ncbi:MAG: metal-dependent hydrolase [Candidatus Thermoplasmatota archaeon]|nr:metal-dependent hydrolase [Candidatus Thermoplasmatota archaeon]